jgi:DNA-directed RNA polymerase subunit F
MEVINPRCTLLTNCEVLTILQEAKSSKSKSLRKHNTVLYEAIKYLKDTPAASQTESSIKELMIDLQKLFKLTSAEVLQIVNLRPKSNTELAMIIEECEDRYTEQQLQEISTLILLHLPDTDTTTIEATVDSAEEGEAAK